jgi:hypothetical protein
MAAGLAAGFISHLLTAGALLTLGGWRSVAAELQVPDPAVLTGRVTDSAGVPIGRAEIRMGSPRILATTTDSGTFRVVVAGGQMEISVRRLGYVGATTTVNVAAGDSVRLRFVLARSAVLLDSVVSSRPLTTAMRRFEDRRHAQQGIFITSAQLRRDDDRPFRAVLGRYATGISLVTYKSGIYASSMRGMATLDPRLAVRAIPSDRRSPAGCWLQVYVDGTRMYAPNGQADALDLGTILTRNVEAVEFYSGAANTPPEFSSSWASCGTLVLWTRSS